MTLSTRLKNIARGGGKYHSHRLEIVRDLLDKPKASCGTLSDFLSGRLYAIDPKRVLFSFGEKDWKICGRLLSNSDPVVEARLVDIVTHYVVSNLESVRRLVAFEDQISKRLLTEQAPDLEEGQDVLPPEDMHSLFVIRANCAQQLGSTDGMRAFLRSALPGGWARANLIYPMIYHFSSHPAANILDNFLSYLVTGDEHAAETLALKLLLSDEAARDAPLSFKAYIGMMGHPYDAMEFVLDHIELLLVDPAPLPDHLRAFLKAMTELLPRSRAARLQNLVSCPLPFADEVDPERLGEAFALSGPELVRYAQICSLASLPAEKVDQAKRPYAILSEMRRREYPVPRQFQIIYAEATSWPFTEGGRLIGALLRSIYMIERTDRDLEARSVLRLLSFVGVSTPFVASMPSGMFTLRTLTAHLPLSEADVAAMETATGAAITPSAPFEDRLWINELQWKLRILEEQGRVREWLDHVRHHTRVRPSYLTGINWHWVEEIINLQRLKPFRNYDGAYLFLHMELEAHSDPERLRIVLEPLLRGLNHRQTVDALIEEFDTWSAAIVRRHMTTQHLLASGLAPNYVAALDQRVRALERCILHKDFGPLLTQEMYENEVRTLTSELLLSNVNTGKFEVPWATFRKDATEAEMILYEAVESLRPDGEESEQLTAFFDNTVSFTNGRTETYRLRRRDGPIFALLTALILDFMRHSAFGLEIILSGRFRHHNLTQEFWNALGSVEAATIRSVTKAVQSQLISEYSTAMENFIDDWCSINMQTRRPDRPEGMFNIVPDQKELDTLLLACSEPSGISAVIDVVVEWIKAKLRTQVAAARLKFHQEVGDGLTAKFNDVKADQLARDEYRQSDVEKVHTAASDAVVRRVEDLQSWFDGVDTASSGSISLYDLSLAAETLFENVIPDRTLRVVADDRAREVMFEPQEVKIAFDLLREIYFNALKHGEGPEVVLTLERHELAPLIYYSFANATSEADPSPKSLVGQRYEDANEAIFREGNTGLFKIAASSATLINGDANVEVRNAGGKHDLLVPLRQLETEDVA